MTITELSQLMGNFGEFVGVIAVVATLVYLDDPNRGTVVAEARLAKRFPTRLP